MVNLIVQAALAALLLVPGSLAAYVVVSIGCLEIATACVLSFLGYWLVQWLIPSVKEETLKAGLFGLDLGKRGTSTADKKIPEALGIVPAVVFMMIVIGLQTVYGTTLERLVEYNSCLLSISFMIFLGFADDVLALKWRYKFVLPFIASLPLLCSYFSEGGVTYVLIPKPLRPLLTSRTGILDGKGNDILERTALGELVNLFLEVDGNILNLGVLYYVYMSSLAIFTTNAINIYAGINGLETGQSLIIGLTILTMNLIEIIYGGDSAYVQNHVFSAIIMIPFVGVTVGLLKYNWYPSQVFVGDTYCYFAGMTFGVVAILGRFSKSLLLFFVPQLINFLYSLPQLLPKRIFPYAVPCPRHRLPAFNPKTGLVEPSRVPEDLHKERPINMTLINLFLRVLGPMREEHLCLTLLAFQVVCCGLGLFFRYQLVHLLF